MALGVCQLVAMNVLIIYSDGRLMMQATISRDDILKQAEKLIGDMSNFKALLEIQYENEVRMTGDERNDWMIDKMVMLMVVRVIVND